MVNLNYSCPIRDRQYSEQYPTTTIKQYPTTTITCKKVIIRLTTLIYFISLLTTSNARAEHGLPLLNINQTINQSDVVINAQSDPATCGGTYRMELELVQSSGSFSGTPNYISSSMVKNVCAAQSYPPITISFNTLSLGTTYKWRVREHVIGSDIGPWSAEFSFTVPKPKVLLLAAEFSNFYLDVKSKLENTEAFTSVDVFELQSSTPTLSLLKEYDAVLVWTDYQPANAIAAGDVVAQYIDAGGGVVSSIFNQTETWGLKGAYNSSTYLIVNQGNPYSFSSSLGVVHNVSHPIMQGVNSFDGGQSSYRSLSNSLTVNSIRIADWADGNPLIAIKENVGPLNARRADLNFFPPSSDVHSGSWLSNTDGTLLMKNALLWVAKASSPSTIATSTISSPRCAGVNVNIPFTVTGTYNSGNVFTAQLSNATGSFTSPTSIGTITGTTSGSINAIIPANIPAGTGYRVRVISSNPAVTGSDNGSDITINTLPTAVLSGGGTICPGGSANLSVALTGTGPWSVTYTDGATPVTVSSITASPHTIPISPGSSKTYSLVSVSDDNCNASSLSGTATVTVNSVPVLTVPTIASVDNDANICGASVAFAATATGVPSPSITYKIGSTTISSPHVFPEGITTVTATATNSCGTDIETFDVTVTNVAPVLTAITPVTIDPVPINTAFSASAIVTDNNLQSGTWTWGDGATSAGVINGTTISGSRTYNATGVYTIGVDVKDACNSTDQATYQYVVVYDPSGGFVTGGGWITSPKNTQLYYMQESGRANFGFVSKYVKGATKPTGETNFQFQTANLHFLSSSYEWLVVSGATARYKGVGTVNGSGNYGFLISAVDGQVTGGGGSDKFRIKIWDKNNNDVVVYDNNLSATGDDALAETIISGGSIVVHEAKKATSSKTIVAVADPIGSSFYSYPTAFSDKTTIAFTLDRAEDYVLEVFDMKGALVKRLAAGAAEANKLYEIELDGTGMREGVYITRLSTSSNVRSLKTVLRR